MIARADQSDMVLWPAWFWALVIILAIATVVLWAVVHDAAPTGATAPAARATTNPECVRRSHSMARFGDSIVWLCVREGCGETWLVMPDEPFDQEAAEVVAEAEQLLRRGGTA